MAGVLIGPDGQVTEWVQVTPEMAATWLALMSGNRTKRRSNINKIRADMLSGRFVAIPHGFVFDVNGRFVDGQHRATLIVETGVTVWVMVTRNVPVSSVTKIDSGAKRTDADHLRIGGYGEHSTSQLAMIKVALRGVAAFSAHSEMVISVEVFQECLDLWQPFLAVVKPLENVRNMKNRVLLGSLLRALLSGASDDRIAEMIQVMATGRAKDAGDDAATLLARAWMDGRISSSGRDMCMDATLKTQNAIKHFLQRKPMSCLRSVDREQFDILPQFMPQSYIPLQSNLEAHRGTVKDD